MKYKGNVLFFIIALVIELNLVCCTSYPSKTSTTTPITPADQAIISLLVSKYNQYVTSYNKLTLSSGKGEDVQDFYSASQNLLAQINLINVTTHLVYIENNLLEGINLQSQGVGCYSNKDLCSGDLEATSLIAQGQVKLAAFQSEVNFYLLTPTIEQVVVALPKTPTNNRTYQSWRLPIMQGAKKYDDDQNQSSEILDWVELTARNLAIPSPYYWDRIGFPEGTRYADVEYYYSKINKANGFSLVQSSQGYNGSSFSNTYLMEFVKANVSQKVPRIFIEFWESGNDIPAQVVIFYINPYTN